MRILVIAIISLVALGLAGQQRLELVANAGGGDARVLLKALNENDGSLSLTKLEIDVGTTTLTKGDLTTLHPNYSFQPNLAGGTGLTNDGTGIFMRAVDPAGKMRFYVAGSSLTENQMTITSRGVGINADDPVADFEIGSAQMLVSSSGSIIMQAANASCWQLTISNAGALSTTSVPCP